MKHFKTIFFTAFIFTLALSLQSCSSDDSPDAQNPETYIRFSINGVNYEFTDIITAESNSITLNGNNGAALTDPGDTQLTVWLPLTLANGTYNVTSDFGAEYRVSFTSSSLNFDFDFAQSGTITLTQTTGEFIIGTFTATITNDDNSTITIENGEFKGVSI